jgi:hypothetical protein
MADRNPNLMSKEAMTAVSQTSSRSRPTVHEILLKVNNAKDKPKKIEVLKEYDTPALRSLLKGAFDPKIKWDLPEGTPPFMANEAPLGTQHTYLEDESKKLWHFVTGADGQLTKTRKETLFIQVLEGLHTSEATLLINIKDKRLNLVYKGLTENAVKEAFGWNDSFLRPEQK